MRAAIFTGLALVATTSLGQAQVLSSDDFSTAGLLTANGWINHSGSGNFVMSDGSVATLDHGGGSREDVNRPFTAIQGATDKTYAAFDISIPTGGVVDPDGNGLYFFHLKDSSFGFRARTGVLSPAAGGDYTLAINADSSALGAGASWATDCTFGTNYRVVVSWDAATGMSEMWVDPVDQNSTSVSHTGTNMGNLMETVAMRQSSDYTGIMHIDNVVAGKTFADVLGGGGPTTPGSAYCFGDGTGATCPCAGFGGAGEGCVNTGGSGATLVASGTALISNDTLQFDIAGVPGVKPGLILRGNNQLSNPVGDGILCTGGSSMRSQVNMTVAGATTYTDFNGGTFGSISNLGTPTNFQFWYRDTGNTCGGGGFNFTNGWTVTYMP